jgi:hypothetical protein
MALVTTVEGITVTAKSSATATTDVVAAMAVSLRLPIQAAAMDVVRMVVRQQAEKLTVVATETAISDKSIATATRSTLVRPTPTTTETSETTKTPQ